MQYGISYEEETSFPWKKGWKRSLSLKLKENEREFDLIWILRPLKQREIIKNYAFGIIFIVLLSFM
jgi:hypothetical protein